MSYNDNLQLTTFEVLLVYTLMEFLWRISLYVHIHKAKVTLQIN